jgi:hypothetical protein
VKMLAICVHNFVNVRIYEASCPSPAEGRSFFRSAPQ